MIRLPLWTFACSVFLLTLVAPSSAQSLTMLSPEKVGLAAGKATRIEQHDDWHMRCAHSENKAEASCTLSAVVEAGELSAPRLSVNIVINDLKKPAIGYFQTPLDLLLSKGIDISIDRRTVGKLSFRSCHQEGCIVPFAFRSALRTHLLRGNKAVVKTHGLSGEAHSGEISLIGLSSALKSSKKFLTQ